MSERTKSLGRPAKVTVSAIKVVQIHIRGERDDRPSDLPRCPVDDGKAHEVLDWMMKEKIHSAVRGGGYSGGGGHLGYYTEEDAERIVAKCKELGIELMDYYEQSALHRRD